MPNPLVLAAVQFFQSIALVDDFIPATQNNWQRCVLASSLGARLGMDIDAVKTEIEGFDPESHIPPGKQNEVFKILNQFLKGVKAQPSWFAQWKEKKAETAKAKQAAGKDGEDQTTKGDDQADGEQTGAAAVADAANGQEGADQSQAAEPAVAGQDAEFKNWGHRHGRGDQGKGQVGAEVRDCGNPHKTLQGEDADRDGGRRTSQVREILYKSHPT